MGKQRLVDKTIRPMTVGLTNLTPAAVTGGRAANTLGMIPIGNYKGLAAFFDLDKLVNQPLVLAEQQHILGILDGREEGHDMVTVTNPLGALLGTQVRGRLTVPAGEVWYISAVVTTIPADATATILGNWRSNRWTDRAVTPDPDGQAFHAAAFGNAAGFTQWDEFGWVSPLWAITNKTAVLRLTSGTVITLECAVAVAPPTADVDSTLQLYGFIGKQLVE